MVLNQNPRFRIQKTSQRTPNQRIACQVLSVRATGLLPGWWSVFSKKSRMESSWQAESQKISKPSCSALFASFLNQKNPKMDLDGMPPKPPKNDKKLAQTVPLSPSLPLKPKNSEFEAKTASNQKIENRLKMFPALFRAQIINPIRLPGLLKV